MRNKADGQNYAPKGKAAPVCASGEFLVGVIGLDHGHIYGMCNGLSEAGADIAWVWDADASKVAAFVEAFPGARPAQSARQILSDESVRMIACASVPGDRMDVGLAAMAAGKDFFADKPPLITREQLASARRAAESTGCRYMTYYSERLHVEAAVYAGMLIEQGAIGRVVQVMGWGPHRANFETRPEWFFDKARYGGILVDIGCHQIEQILAFAGASSAEINFSRVANYHSPEYARFEDFGEASLLCDNGVSGYFRVDWLTPRGLDAWGDGRVLIVGTDGYIELRKYIDVAADAVGDHVIVVNHEGERHLRVAGQCGFPFFGALILDCLNRTENAMTQRHVFAAIELAIQAQENALQNGVGGF